MIERLPQDTKNTKYVAWPQYDKISLGELRDYAEKFFPGVDAYCIKIDLVEIQIKCFGYDLYDPADYQWYYVFSCPWYGE